MGGTRGLEVLVDELQVGDRAPRFYIDVSCRDASMNENFTGLATEVCEALIVDRDNVKPVLESILERWRWFWGNLPRDLSEEMAVGLFRELWFLEYCDEADYGRPTEELEWSGGGSPRLQVVLRLG